MTGLRVHRHQSQLLRRNVFIHRSKIERSLSVPHVKETWIPLLLTLSPISVIDKELWPLYSVHLLKVLTETIVQPFSNRGDVKDKIKNRKRYIG